MDRRVIVVRAAPGGWQVASDLFEGPLIFASGGGAEREATRLGQAAAEAGHDVSVLVHDLSDRLVACIEVPAALSRMRFELEPSGPAIHPATHIAAAEIARLAAS
jgi:hypothetical protein